MNYFYVQPDYIQESNSLDNYLYIEDTIINIDENFIEDAWNKTKKVLLDILKHIQNAFKKIGDFINKLVFNTNTKENNTSSDETTIEYDGYEYNFEFLENEFIDASFLYPDFEGMKKEGVEHIFVRDFDKYVVPYEDIVKQKIHVPTSANFKDVLLYNFRGDKIKINLTRNELINDLAQIKKIKDNSEKQFETLKEQVAKTISEFNIIKMQSVHPYKQALIRNSIIRLKYFLDTAAKYYDTKLFVLKEAATLYTKLLFK